MPVCVQVAGTAMLAGALQVGSAAKFAPPPMQLAFGVAHAQAVQARVSVKLVPIEILLV
jgi:hypothetical protein